MKPDPMCKRCGRPKRRIPKGALFCRDCDIDYMKEKSRIWTKQAPHRPDGTFHGAPDRLKPSKP